MFSISLKTKEILLYTQGIQKEIKFNYFKQPKTKINLHLQHHTYHLLKIRPL